MEMTISADRSTHAGSRQMRLVYPPRGFTLLEMLVTVSILGILAVVAIPSLNNIVRENSVRQGASEIFSALMFARSEAVKRNTDIDVVPTSGNWANGWEIRISSPSQLLQSHSALPGDIASITVGTITYGQDGRLKNTPVSDLRFQIAATSGTATVRCVDVRISGAPVVRVDHNRDGNCGNG
jgi:type IV fimbrial biogenesis protein FimT